MTTHEGFSWALETRFDQVIPSNPWHDGRRSGRAACRSSSADGTSSTNAAAHAGVASTGPWWACGPRGFPCAFQCPCGDPCAWHPNSCARGSENALSQPVKGAEQTERAWLQISLWCKNQKRIYKHIKDVKIPRLLLSLCLTLWKGWDPMTFQWPSNTKAALRIIKPSLISFLSGNCCRSCVLMVAQHRKVNQTSLFTLEEKHKYTSDIRNNEHWQQILRKTDLRKQQQSNLISSNKYRQSFANAAWCWSGNWP